MKSNFFKSTLFLCFNALLDDEIFSLGIMFIVNYFITKKRLESYRAGSKSLLLTFESNFLIFCRAVDKCYGRFSQNIHAQKKIGVIKYKWLG